MHVDPATTAPDHSGPVIEVRADPGNAYWAFGLQDVKPGFDQQWKYLNEMRTIEFDIRFDASSAGVEDILIWPTGTYQVPSTPLPFTTDSTSGYLLLSMTHNPNATDLTYTVGVTTNLGNPSGWTSTGTMIETNTPAILSVSDNQPVTNVPRRSMRLKVTRP